MWHAALHTMSWTVVASTAFHHLNVVGLLVHIVSLGVLYREGNILSWGREGNILSWGGTTC